MQTLPQKIDGTEAADWSHAHTGRHAPDESLESSDTLRVTPEEVAIAAAAFEAKRDAEHSWRETSLPLGEAIQHLGLNATPQELAPEVAALRTERAKRATQAQQDQISKAAGIGVGIGTLVAVLFMVIVVWIDHMPPPRTTLPTQKLAAIPDNVPVHIDSDTLLKLAKGDVAPAEVSVDARAQNRDEEQYDTKFNNEWPIVKSKGNLLVKGWATAEFALNISNESSGAFFSHKPGWLPADNLVPVQVPVYRLERQSFSRYTSDGKTANDANSAVLGMSVAETAKVMDDLVQDAILATDKNFTLMNWEGYSHIDVRFIDNVVHLTGNATTADLKKRAGEVTTELMKNLHLSYPIANDLVIAQNAP